MDMLEVKDLSVKVEGKLILKGLSFSLKEGASHILFGPNGSGKTTLISTLMGCQARSRRGQNNIQRRRHHRQRCR
jgi:Fe-S cluster assembly ATP-binding protein